MEKMSVIKALRTGVLEATDTIEYLVKKHKDEDPIIKHLIEQLRTLLSYSGHVYNEPAKKHQLYDN